MVPTSTCPETRGWMLVGGEICMVSMDSLNVKLKTAASELASSYGLVPKVANGSQLAGMQLWQCSIKNKPKSMKIQRKSLSA